MSQNTFNLIRSELNPENAFTDQLIKEYRSWMSNRVGWENEVTEINDYLFATDTSTTTNSSLPFANTVTIPKLAQVNTNLITNYLRHLFPNRKWAEWHGADAQSVDMKVKRVIEGYVRAKLEHSRAELVLARCIEDWTQKGIAVGRTRYVREVKKNQDGSSTVLYSGAKTERINPLNFAYDVTASNLEEARKYIREIYSMGDLARMVQEDANSFLTAEQFEEMRKRRQKMRDIAAQYTRQDGLLSRRLQKAGFGDMMAYYQGDTVEVLQVYGDFYDVSTGEYMQNHRLTIVDQKEIVQKIPLENIDGGDDIHVSVWEFRADSLSPISPLARIVGMQHKLDKLENIRADVFDNIAHPTMIEIGDVEFVGTRGMPGGYYSVEEGGDVRPVSYNTVALTADTQQFQTMQLMEELSGSPRESAGFRTPGEKTKFEVQLLDGAANNVFLRKVRQFEEEFLVSLLRSYLELGRRYADVDDIIRVTNDELGTAQFLNITSDQLTGQGTMVPKGATLLTDKANALQTLTSLSNTNLFGLIGTHISKKRLAKMIDQLTGFDEFNIFLPNIGIQEDMETQRLVEQEQQRAQSAAVQDSTVTQPQDGVEGDEIIPEE